MTNVHYLRTQLTMALDCIRRGLDALEAEPAAPELPPVRDAFEGAEAGGKIPDSLGLQSVTPQQKLWIALTERVDKLTQIVLSIDLDACAKHDLFPF